MEVVGVLQSNIEYTTFICHGFAFKILQFKVINLRGFDVCLHYPRIYLVHADIYYTHSGATKASMNLRKEGKST